MRKKETMLGMLRLALTVSILFGVGESLFVSPRSSVRLTTAMLRTSTALSAASDAAGSSSEEESEDTPDEPKGKRKYVQSRLQKLVETVRSLPLVPTGVALLTGYQFGVKMTLSRSVTETVATATKNTVVSRARRWPLVTVLLVAFGIKEVWFATPDWIKGNLRRKKNGEADTLVDPNDLTSLVATSAKLQSMFALASSKLKENDDGANSEDDDIDMTIPFLVAMRLMAQIKDRHAYQRDEGYQQGEQALDLSKNSTVLQGLDELFEYADWAYDELPNEQPLAEALAEKGYSLLRHDKPGKPGYVSHYVAINKEHKTALIGIKGTSGLEDMLTDCCGLAVSHKLPGPYIKGGNSTIICHEGILLSSQRLAADLEVLVEEFLLPTGYDLVVTGHSLGAGVAALVAVLLRARFPSLWKDGVDGTSLRVMAFASPPILDCDAALACAPFVTTVVNNADIIPRSSLSNLIVLMKFLKTVNKKLEDTGEKPTNIMGLPKFMLSLSKSGNMAMSVDEVKVGMDQAYDSVELRDPDHLYVPGKVIHMYDLWSKTHDEKIERAMEDDVLVRSHELMGNETSTFAERETNRTAEGAMITDGTSKKLRSIELDSRFLTDHLSPAYRSSIRSLLDRNLP